MTTTPEQHKAMMTDMKSFDEPMPAVGIFWYDPEEHSFFGVRKKEMTPKIPLFGSQPLNVGILDF